jgi:hypothetical protein
VVQLLNVRQIFLRAAAERSIVVPPISRKPASQ